MGKGQCWMQSMRPYYQDPGVRFCANVSGHWDALNVRPYSGEMYMPNWDVKKNWVASFSNAFRGKEQPVVVTDPYQGGQKEGVAGSFGVNGWLQDPNPRVYYGTAGEHWGALSAVKTPSIVPLLGDAYWVDGWPKEDDQPQDSQFDPATMMVDDYQMHRFLVVRHGKYFANWVFVDGHTEKVMLKKLWGFRWSKNYKTDNQYTKNNCDWKWLYTFPK